MILNLSYFFYSLLIPSLTFLHFNFPALPTESFHPLLILSHLLLQFLKILYSLQIQQSHYSFLILLLLLYFISPVFFHYPFFPMPSLCFPFLFFIPLLMFIPLYHHFSLMLIITPSHFLSSSLTPLFYQLPKSFKHPRFLNIHVYNY